MIAFFMYKEDTIAAIATPPGEGGVAIVRISGPDAERIAVELFSRRGARNGELNTHRLYHGVIREPDGAILDQVLLTIMRSPRSYTGEDVVEIHCHGGLYLVRRVLELVLSRGARHAEAGEFTKRAFLNGRVDLAQAEAVADLIRARTDAAMKLALNQMDGKLSHWVGEVRENLLDLSVQVEAAIDFPEEEIELLQRPKLIAKINRLGHKILEIIDTYEWARLFREGAKVCICGRPNVGKSSLLNALLGEERVIVTPVPGTTRDVIEESINLGGLPVVLWDTAGIHETIDPIESIGVKLSLKHLHEADAALVVLDGSVPLVTEDRSLLALLSEKKSLIVINKSDLPRQWAIEEINGLADESEGLVVSAKLGDGIEELKRALKKLLMEVEAEPAIVVASARHRAALVQTEEVLADAVSALEMHQPAEIVAVSLQEAREKLEEIIGAVSSDDILKRIFASFCIGK